MPVAQEVPKVKVTPFRIFLGELKKRRADFATCGIAVACIAVSTRLVTLKNERRFLDMEHEEKMADLQEDNRKLRDQLEKVREKVMQEAGKSGKKLEPLATRLDAVFDDVVVAKRAPSATETEEVKSKKKDLRKFFV